MGKLEQQMVRDHRKRAEKLARIASLEAENRNLRTAISQEREAREKAEKRADELHATVEAQSPIVASYIAEQSGEAKPISVLGDWLRLVAKERHRAEAAEASLAEAKRLGGMLANAAYNICQRGEIDAVTLRSLNEARQAWDDMSVRFLEPNP